VIDPIKYLYEWYIYKNINDVYTPKEINKKAIEGRLLLWPEWNIVFLNIEIINEKR